MRRSVLVMAAAFALVFSGAAAASVLGSGSSATPEPGEYPEGTEVLADTDPGTLGGPIERFHEAGACDLTDVSVLSGNWTHGSYVAAVAQAGDPSLVPDAARSDCGKPMVAVDHGGPPENGLEHIPEGTPGAASEAHSQGPPGS
jgi:hypothetical protein